jgi:hypothetical protein
MANAFTTGSSSTVKRHGSVGSSEAAATLRPTLST